MLSMTERPVKSSEDLIGAAKAATDPLVARQIRHVLAEQTHAAGRGRKIAGDGVEQGGLSRTVRAQNRAPLAQP